MKTPHGGGGVVAFDCRKLAEVYAFPQSKATDGDGTDGTGAEACGEYGIHSPQRHRRG